MPKMSSFHPCSLRGQPLIVFSMVFQRYFVYAQTHTYPFLPFCTHLVRHTTPVLYQHCLLSQKPFISVYRGPPHSFFPLYGHPIVYPILCDGVFWLFPDCVIAKFFHTYMSLRINFQMWNCWVKVLYICNFNGYCQIACRRSYTTSNVLRYLVDCQL